jgi:outer membrane protein insertion porin family
VPSASERTRRLHASTNHWRRSGLSLRVGAAWLAALASPLWARPQANAPAAKLWGKNVAQVQLQCRNAHLTIKDFAQEITQKVGQPLDRGEVAKSLKRLYATGRFTELRADASRVQGGVALTFVGRARYFIGAVSAQGAPSSLDPRALANTAHLQLGQPMAHADLRGALGRLKGMFRENGYYQPKITVSVERDPATEEANITFSIRAGPPARLGKVSFEGVTVFPQPQLLALTKWRSGRHLTASGLDRGLFRLRHFYTAHGYLQANILLRRRNYNPKTNTEQIVVGVEAGPIVKVRLLGAKLSLSKLRGLLPVYTDGVVDPFSLARGAEELEDYFQQRSYLWARVAALPVAHPEPNHLLITYSVHRGPEGEFDGYRFKGNRHIPSADLSSVISFRSQGVFFQHPIFSNRILADNVRALQALYTSRGYLDAQVSPELDSRDQGQPNHLLITFAIREGARTTVSSLTLHGVTPAEQRQVWPLLKNKPGDPFSLSNEARDRLALLRFFADRGFPRVRANVRATPVAGRHSMKVTYTVERGPKQVIKRILLVGNKYTRNSTVRRQLTFSPGKPSSDAAILKSQSQLYDLGVFNQVQIAPQNPEGLETGKNLLVQMEEAKRWTVSYGGGLEVQRLGGNQPQGQLKASPRVSLDVTRLDVGGRAQTASFRGRFSTLDRGASLSYFVPRFHSRRNWALRLNGLFDRSNDVLTFTAERAEASISLEKRFSPGALLAVRYSFRHVLAFNLSNTVSVAEIPLFSLPARIGMAGVSYINDHRDNPVNPTRGSYTVADAGVAWSGLASEADFLRFSGENATYYRLGRGIIFARDTRFGIESPYGALRLVHTTGPNGQPESILTREIPLPERFFMGGSESHRGFSINQAGPRDPVTGFPIGGDALFLNSFELRIPIVENRLGLVLFHDMGNVYSSIRRMKLFKVTQSSPTDFDYTVHAVGVGLRYQTPVGPLRFDLGYALNPTRFEVQQTVNGVTTQEVQQLPHFQFFIGIGQTF